MLGGGWKWCQGKGGSSVGGRVEIVLGGGWK